MDIVFVFLVGEGVGVRKNDKYVICFCIVYYYKILIIYINKLYLYIDMLLKYNIEYVFFIVYLFSIYCKIKWF